MLVALILVGVLLLFGLIISNVVVSAIRDSANVNRSNQAFYAAEGALEEGLYTANQLKGAGYSDPAPVSVVFGTGANSVNNLNASYKIQGQVPLTSKYNDGSYGIPTPGTGDVGSGCDPLYPYIASGFWYSPTNTPHYSATDLGGYTFFSNYKDHPCNWNQISVGKPVNIPLYVTNADGTISNPIDLGLSSIIIKIRTPCMNGDEMCSPINRYDLAYDLSTPGSYALTNNTVVSWQVVGTSTAEDKSYTFIPNDLFDLSNCSDVLNMFGRCIPPNSEIYEALINFKRGSGFEVLNTMNDVVYGEEIQSSQQGLLMDFLKNTGGFVKADPNDDIYKPILKLSVIYNLQDSGGANIPYLEYQVLTDSLVAPTNVVQTITSEGYSGSFKQILEVKQPQESGILEYVIQQ